MLGWIENCVLSPDEYARVKRDEVDNSAMAVIEGRHMKESTGQVNAAILVGSKVWGRGG